MEEDKSIDLMLLMTKEVIRYDENGKYPRRAPMYHVWLGDSWVYCNSNMRGAYQKYYEMKGRTQDEQQHLG